MRQYIRGSYGPKLLICDSCYDAIYDLTHLTYRKMGSRAIEQKIIIRDKGKCLPDCISFICHKESANIGMTEKEERPNWVPPRPSRVYKMPRYADEGDILELERLRLQMRSK